MKIKTNIYSLLLLIVLTLGGSGFVSQLIHHCSSHHHNHHHSELAEHYCSHNDDGCSGHNSAFKHSCNLVLEAELEYVVVNKQRVQHVNNFSSLSLRDVVNFVVAPRCLLLSDYDRRVEVDIFNCYDPTTGLLRAPPALV